MSQDEATWVFTNLICIKGGMAHGSIRISPGREVDLRQIGMADGLIWISQFGRVPRIIRDKGVSIVRRVHEQRS
jgi:hypothetical protein